jgi:signal peptidase
VKRAIGLIFLILACIAGFLTVKGVLPFVPIFGQSMDPALRSGSLLVIKNVNPGDIKVGDIIVYRVTAAAQDYYKYPPVVSRRVIEIKVTPTLGFITKGDNTGIDPITVRPADIRGTVGSRIPFAALPLLLFQSQQGLIFAAVALILLTILLYSSELLRHGIVLLHGGSLWHRGIPDPVIVKKNQNNRPSPHRFARKQTKSGKAAPVTRKKVPAALNTFREGRGLTKEALAAEQKISGALERLRSNSSSRG